MAGTTPRIGITMGDAAGIGPEIIIKALSDPNIRSICRAVIIGDYVTLERTARELSPDLEIVQADSLNESVADSAVPILSISKLTDIKKGFPSEEAGRAAGLYIEEGASLALAGSIAALVTAPISKESFNLGGYSYPGHTEFLSCLTGEPNYAMMLMGGAMKVVLLTIHCPLMEVARRLSIAETLRIIRLTAHSLNTYFAVRKPRLALAGLNPHAGERGLFGKEELEILTPAAEAARKEGIYITDPLPSDTLFHKAAGGDYDTIICPYHDQGLIPLKMLHFHDGVNVTLGLPIIRTSPDHGTAFNIAGKGIANPESMKAAIITAVSMSQVHRDQSL